MQHRFSKILAGLGGLFLASQFATAAVFTTVTASDLQGWTLADGRGGGSPGKITGAQPHPTPGGTGSLQLDIGNSNQQPLAVYGFAGAPRVGDLLTSGLSFSFSYMLPVGSPPATSPTIRLILDGLTDTPQSGRDDGSLGWYANGAGDGQWHNEIFNLNSGNFFFRIGGVGQAGLGCSTFGGSFDDRRQTIGQWGSECTGTGGTYDLVNAVITGIEVDWGSFATSTAVTSYADLVTFNIGSNAGAYDFELAAAAAVPEPGSLALTALALGLAGFVGRRARRQNPSA